MRKLTPILLVLLATGCLDGAGEIEFPAVEESDLVSPFASQVTGYVSDGALELDATFEGIMEFPLSREADPQRFVSDLRAGRGVAELAVDHMRFSHRPLLPAKQRVNLANASLEWYQVVENGDQVQLSYRLTTESLVAWKDLEADNTEPTSLVGRKYDIKLPADPRRLFERVGESCAVELGQNDHLNDLTYFYYFDRTRAGCDLPATWATLTLDRLHIPLGTYYPEYDRLTADGKISVAIFFDGALEQPSENWDQSAAEFRELQSFLEGMGFVKSADLDPFGERYLRTRNGIEQVIDMVGPTQWSAMSDTDDAFHRAMQTHEVIAYQGHAFIGMLNLFNRPDSYPADTYQIFFLGVCWGYHYYVNQILDHKATGRDPSGWELADVVSATERPYFSNGGDQIRILLANLFQGAETGGIDSERSYDWKGIIGKMNRRAEEWYQIAAPWLDISDNEYYVVEIFGASGVTTNCYDPHDPQKCTGGSSIPDCEDDDYEDNDTPATASLTTGALNALQICSDDEDWYRIAAQPGDTLEVEILFAHQSGDLDLQVFGSEGLGELLAVSQSTTDNERIALSIESPGDYYIQVFGYASAENSYLMTVGLIEGEEECPDDRFEPNDEVARATELSNLAWGPNSFPDLMVCTQDEDWYAVPLYTDELLTVDLSFRHVLGDIDIQILDENLQVLASGISADDNEFVEYATTDERTVYLRIYGYASAENAYQMQIAID